MKPRSAFAGKKSKVALNQKNYGSKEKKRRGKIFKRMQDKKLYKHDILCIRGVKNLNCKLPDDIQYKKKQHIGHILHKRKTFIRTIASYYEGCQKPRLASN